MTPQRRRGLLCLLSVSLLSSGLSACAAVNPSSPPATPKVSNSEPEIAAINSIPVIHVFVALADNVNQGIVPVSASLGDGDSPKTNLYWGAAFGIRTFFSKSSDWELISVTSTPSAAILERCIFKHRRASLLMVADAYQGKRNLTNHDGLSRLQPQESRVKS